MSVPDLSLLHFIRPIWLLAILPAIVLWWQVRRGEQGRGDVVRGIAPHLARGLDVRRERRERLLPIDGVLMVSILLAVGAAGPTWSRVANPFLAQTAPLVIVLEVTESMEESDIAPSRLERAKQKVADLLALRSGGRTALVAYAGSAHRVVPLTDDPEVMKPFLEGLEPDVMPRKGDNAPAALSLASEIMSDEQTPGAILWLGDGIAGADKAAFDAHRAAGGASLVGLALTRDASGGQSFRDAGISTVDLTAGTEDIARIDRIVARAWRDAEAGGDAEPWDDRGWLLAWPAALLVLLWFRRGWTMRWDGQAQGLAPLIALPLASLVVVAPASARADGIAALFLTPDQQGRIAFEDNRFGEAADLFADPAWRGHALYRAGRYEEAITVLAEIETAEAAITAGLAMIKSRQYRQAVAAFELALERQPGNAAAARNLEIARAIVDEVETTREQSDTGEEAGIGADDTVFDNESGRGTETRIAGDGDDAPPSAEQWMRTVDTRTGDFLKSRFALELATGAPSPAGAPPAEGSEAVE